MKKIDFKQQVLPHLIAVVVFILIAVFFSYPVVFENKELSQGDILQWTGGAKELLDYREETGQEGLWTNSMFGGMPAYLITVMYSGDVSDILQSIYTLGLPHPAGIIFGSMIGYYLMLLAFRVRPYLSLAGAITFGITSFNIISIEAGHNAKVLAMAYLPLIVAGLRLTFNQHRLWGFTLTAIGLALQLRATHLQITYYTLLILVIYGISELIWHFRNGQAPRFLQRSLILAAAAVIAIGANLGRILPVYEYGKFSIRGATELTAEPGQDPDGSGLNREYAFSWSSGVWESFTLLVPNFYGGGTVENVGTESALAEALANNNIPRNQIRELVQNAPTYWGDQPSTAGPIYAGAIVCFLFVLGILLVDNRFRVWLIVTAVFGLLLAWGKNFELFNYFMFDYFPGYNKFRSVSMTIYITLFALPLLGFLGLEKVFTTGFTKEIRREILKAAAIAGGLTLLIILASVMLSFRGAVDAQLASYPEWYIDAIRTQRASMLRADAFRSLFFIGSALGLLYFFWRGKLSSGMTLGLLAFLSFLDLGLVGKRYLNSENFVRKSGQNFFTETPADQRILADTASFRVLNLRNPFNDARTSYFHQSIGGYHGAKMRRYQDLIDRCLGNEISGIITSLQNQRMDFPDHPVLNMLNTRYFMAGEDANAVLTNENALNNAWLVARLQPVSSPDEEIEAVCGIEPARTAVIDTSRFEVDQLQYNAGGSIELVNYEPGRVEYQANLQGEGFAVFSEIYYPEGWEATVNGEPADILRVNYVLRGLQLPAGQYEVAFNFNPPSYSISQTVMWIFGILLILVLLYSLFHTWRRLNSEESVNPVRAG